MNQSRTREVSANYKKYERYPAGYFDLTKAQEFITLKQYVFPEGENAKELIDKVFSVDSSNKEARNLLYDMAARCILEGDVAKSKLQAEEAKKSYLTAQAIGVSPDFIDKKLQGIELIKHSSSSVIIVDSEEVVEIRKRRKKLMIIILMKQNWKNIYQL